MPWSPLPVPLTPFYEGDELGAINTTITFTPPPLGVIDGYSVVLVGDPQSVFTVVAGASGIVVTTLGSNLVGVYPLERLTYLDSSLNSVNVTQWTDVPHGSIMTAAIPDSRREIEWSIECTANWTDEMLAPQVAEETYTVIVQQSYDANQATLKQKITEQL